MSGWMLLFLCVLVPFPVFAAVFTSGVWTNCAHLNSIESVALFKGHAPHPLAGVLFSSCLLMAYALVVFCVAVGGVFFSFHLFSKEMKPR